MYFPDYDIENNRRLGTILRLQAKHNGDTTFLLEGERRLSYAEVNSLVNQYVQGLRKLGISPGDRILIFLHGCTEFVLLALAAHKLGAIWVPVNTDYRGQWLAETLDDSRASLLITEQDLLPRIDEVRDQVSFGRQILKSDLQDFQDLADDEPDMSHIHYGDTCAILWTSGTTGKSKGVMQSHNVWVRACTNNHKNYETRAGDIIYNCLPMYNSAAWVACIYHALVAGIGCAIDPVFSVGDFWGRIRHYGATQTMTLGAMHMFLWNQPANDDDADNPLRMANMVPMPEALLKPFGERFGIEGNLQGFGQSEVMLLLSRKDTPDNPWKANALGGLSDGLELQLLDDDGVQVPPGESGEFCVQQTQPHQIFNGYFENPEAEAAAFIGDWYHTGDLGMCDAEGNYFFVDRKKDIIRYKGRNVSSVQIESIAQQHPAIGGAAAYAVKAYELDWEDVIKLDVVLAEGTSLSAEDLARHVNDNAPYFCVPRYIDFVQALPYTPTNKVQKYKLRNQPVAANVWDRTTTDFKLER
jgi:crotonobetaine/carnitine-CoA ligase